MKLKIILMMLLATGALAQADDKVAQAQQALKDQGFYYGDVTGEKNVETTAAIRRYQIRSGLNVTGELDEETLRSLASGPAKAETPIAQYSPPPRQSAPDQAEESSRETDSDRQFQPFNRDLRNDSDHPIERYGAGPGPVYPSNPATVVPPGGGLFAGTPYATAPPEVQRDLIASAQRNLERKELYHGDVDGIYGPTMEFSLRAYQSKIGLPVTGRLDLETLAALNLLPGSRMPVFVPHRQLARPRMEPPVRGEWIRE